MTRPVGVGAEPVTVTVKVAGWPTTTAVGPVSAVLEVPVTVSEYAWEPVSPLLSVAVTVKMNVPVAVGVPPRMPAELRLMPAGNAPDSLKVKLPLPPVAEKVCVEDGL